MFGNGKIFVSHTHEDNAACERVLAALDAWQVDYWFDTAQLSAGLELLDNIQRGLQGRDIYLRICTPAANGSPWMAQEQKLARTLRAPTRDQRLMIDLIVKPGYVVAAEETHDLVIDTTQQPEVEWLRQIPRCAGDSLTRATYQSARSAWSGDHLAGGARWHRLRRQAAVLHSSQPESLSAHGPPAHADSITWRRAHPLDVLALSAVHLEAPPASFWQGRR